MGSSRILGLIELALWGLKFRGLNTVIRKKVLGGIVQYACSEDDY